VVVVLGVVALYFVVPFDFVSHRVHHGGKHVFDNHPYMLTKCEHGYYTYPYKVHDGTSTYYLNDGTEIGQCMSMKPYGRTECERAEKAVGKCEKEYIVIERQL